jgi:hypothetical protein
MTVRNGRDGRGAARQSLMAKVEMPNRIAMRSLVAVRIEE